MTTPILLSSLFAEFPFAYDGMLPDVEITGIAIDSRKIQPGNLFIAIPGGSSDGHRFIGAAIERGAAAVVGQQRLDDLPVPYVRVENARRSVTYLAAAFYDYPGKSLIVIGVTGTDGKTTTSNLLYQVLLAGGFKVGMISTVNAVIGDDVLDTGFHVTTPDPQDVQFYLSRMVAAGLTHVVLETTSHGLAQFRADASQYDIAVVTNITHEHLDEHGSYENYRAAKGRLFELLAGTVEKPSGNYRLGVLNYDDTRSYDYLAKIAGMQQLSYGLTTGADVHAENIQYDPSGIRFDAVGQGFCVPVHSSLVGAFNISNCLAALCVGISLGIDPQIAAKGIANLSGVPGRMERIDLGQPFTAIVDFAHTPNALKVAIEAARTMTSGRVITVFGSAGLRDKQKRRMMAEISAELADLSILTAEDPRVESLDGILEEMVDGARSKGGMEERDFWRVADRGDAIRFALRLAQPGDIVMACGKGHEQSMCFGTTEYLWDDRTAMRAALAELMGLDGYEMPYLPTSKGSA